MILLKAIRKTMKNLRLLLIPASLLCLLSGCSLQEKYDKNNAAGQAWLKSAKTGSARTNIEGVYYSPDWGSVLLNQNKNDITGTIGHYKISGVLSGKNASLLLIDDEWIDYTMVLTRKNSEELVGSYSCCVPYSAENSTPIHLFRIEN